MTARFGDFVALAAEHLADVDRLPVEDSSALARTALIGQLADFTEIVLGIERRFAWEAVEALPHRSGPAAGIADRLADATSTYAFLRRAGRERPQTPRRRRADADPHRPGPLRRLRPGRRPDRSPHRGARRPAPHRGDHRPARHRPCS
ncbi:hypothetical protein [Kitasatospora sp. NPDC127116]|uniref:hypothetical protein n=1 Tax=Kitasatospora sp. NPDC127116 TaxID=3345367 RepID=UPI003643AFB5